MKPENSRITVFMKRPDLFDFHALLPHSPLICIAFIILISSNASFAQKKNFGLDNAIRWLALPPSAVADSMRKYGYQKADCIGHPWKDSQDKDYCLMNEESGIAAAVSPRPSGRGSELLLMYKGAATDNLITASAVQNNFEHLEMLDKRTNNRQSEWWSLKGNSILAAKLFMERKIITKATPAENTYFNYLYYDHITESEVYEKLSPLPTLVPPVKMEWSKVEINWYLPKDARVESMHSYIDSLKITWPGGDWTTGPIRVGTQYYIDDARTGGSKPPWAELFVKDMMSGVVKDRVDSVICQKDEHTGLNLCMVESDGNWNGKKFVSAFFAFTTKGGKIVFGDYTSMDPIKGKATRKKLTESVLATYQQMLKAGKK